LRLDDLSSLVSQTNKGNTWLGSYSGGFAAENAQTSRSTIFYFGSLSPAKFRAAPYKPFNLFQPNTGTDNDACNGTIGNVSGGSNSNGQVSLRDIILNGDLSFERFETPLIYQNEESLYEELKPLEESLPDTSVELAFIHRLDTLSIGAFYDLEQQALAYSMKSTADSAMLDQSNAARDSLEKQLSYYDAIRANQADSLTDSLRLEIDTAMAFLLDQLAPIQALLDEYQANAHTRLQWQCDTLLSMTRLVEVLDTPTQLKKRFYELYFRTVARGS
jgi:hypothetical protein